MNTKRYAELIDEIVVKKQFRDFTFRQLMKETNFFPMKAPFYYVFALSYNFTYEMTEYGNKYICHEYPTQTQYLFDNPTDLGTYMFNIIPKIRYKCNLCTLGYFNINPKLLAETFNGKCIVFNNKLDKYELLKSKCNENYCISCIKWTKNLSPEISNLPKNIENILPTDLWKVIDKDLKSFDFICEVCEDYVCPTNRIKNSSYFNHGYYLHMNEDNESFPSGKCWSCFKRNL